MHASRSCHCWKLTETGKLLEMIMKGVITSWESRGKVMENLVYGRKLQEGVAGKGRLIFYHVCLIHHPGESVSFEKERSSLSIRVNVELTSLMSITKEWESLPLITGWSEFEDLLFQQRVPESSRTQSLRKQGQSLAKCRPSEYTSTGPEIRGSVSSSKTWTSRLDQRAFKDLEKPCRFSKCPGVHLQAVVEVSTHRSESTPSSLKSDQLWDIHVGILHIHLFEVYFLWL